MSWHITHTTSHRPTSHHITWCHFTFHLVIQHHFAMWTSTTLHHIALHAQHIYDVKPLRLLTPSDLNMHDVALSWFHVSCCPYLSLPCLTLLYLTLPYPTQPYSTYPSLTYFTLLLLPLCIYLCLYLQPSLILTLPYLTSDNIASWLIHAAALNNSRITTVSELMSHLLITSDIPDNT